MFVLRMNIHREILRWTGKPIDLTRAAYDILIRVLACVGILGFWGAENVLIDKNMASFRSSRRRTHPRPKNAYHLSADFTGMLGRPWIVGHRDMETPTLLIVTCKNVTQPDVSFRGY